MIDPATLICQAGVTTIDRALPKGRAAHPGSAVRVQVHFDPLWWPRFWLALWGIR